MSSEEIKKNYLKPGTITRDDSLEDFVFLDDTGDLDVDLSKSPIEGAAKKLESGISLVFSALCTIVEEQGMTLTVPVQAMATTAVGAITGSLIGGPPGLAIGLVTGAIMAYRTSPKRQKSPKVESKKPKIREIFSQLTVQQKIELVKELLGCMKHSNVRILVVEIMKNEKIRNMALGVLSNFLLKKMGICLAKGNN